MRRTFTSKKRHEKYLYPVWKCRGAEGRIRGVEGNFEWLIEVLNEIEEFDPTTERIDFREDIFKRIVERGDVSDDGSILYELNIGVTRTADGNDIAIWKVGKR